MGDAIDVDNSSDYKEMVKKISGEKPLIVKVFVDTRHIDKLPRRGSKTGGCIGSEDDSSTTASDLDNGAGVHTIFTNTQNAANICDYRELVILARNLILIIVLHNGA